MPPQPALPGARVCILNASRSCELSCYQLQRISEFLRCNGYQLTNTVEDADCALINGCCVTTEKTGEGESAVDKALGSKAGLVILVGCLGRNHQASPRPRSAGLHRSQAPRRYRRLVPPRSAVRFHARRGHLLGPQSLPNPGRRNGPLSAARPRLHPCLLLLHHQGCAGRCPEP